MKTKDVWIVLCVFATRDDVSNWARVVAYEIGFVTVIMRLDTNIVMKGSMYEKKHKKVNCISSGLTSYCKWYKYGVDSFFKGMSNW